ncbi:MAG: type II toxin-antitoxin system HicB family antitoxin [Chroococcales cyanobacterium]
MQYQIFIQTQSNQRFIASVVGMSNLIAEGTTEAEALEKVKTALEATLATGKFINLEMAESPPQMKWAGIFANDPTFDDFLDKLTQIRQEANALDEPV